jgi:uncharacterized OB-fold protein
VWSAVTVHRAASKSFQEKTPYVIGMVRLAPSLVVMAYLEADDADPFRIDEEVELDAAATRERAALVYARARS